MVKLKLSEYYLSMPHLLLTVSPNGQYYFHTNTFSRGIKNEKIAPRNPIYFEVVKHDFLTGGMIPKLVLITTKNSEVKAQQPLRPFNPSENFIHRCHRNIVSKEYIDFYREHTVNLSPAIKLGEFLVIIGQYDKARDYFENLLKTDYKDEVHILYNLAWIDQCQGRYKDAQVQLDRAYELENDDGHIIIIGLSKSDYLFTQ
ncbi:unnamed protein product [Didymodactylos carnosus]|uniref:Tetratricopeptide repeat protein n=1 Tax=Didymodactylos carnosus TaxID=1234261 RepID=A0A814LH05_9BILA|nr:unnamed protein product [Didymodactylos carnosus]CAF1074982.1 unnamed protein product [Didymodactylos carnosus]CAF3831477.1 unnamed protein product [Didymodactylos carnosus]CAF3838862.1 unnamed protein product [Didymodactylos carnosus]